jgi:hypothetical protein
MEPRHVLPGLMCRLEISATISSSDKGAVLTMRQPGGQCDSTPSGTSDPA